MIYIALLAPGFLNTYFAFIVAAGGSMERLLIHGWAWLLVNLALFSLTFLAAGNAAKPKLCRQGLVATAFIFIALRSAPGLSIAPPRWPNFELPATEQYKPKVDGQARRPAVAQQENSTDDLGSGGTIHRVIAPVGEFSARWIGPPWTCIDRYDHTDDPYIVRAHYADGTIKDFTDKAAYIGGRAALTAIQFMSLGNKPIEVILPVIPLPDGNAGRCRAYLQQQQRRRGDPLREEVGNEVLR
jgi:hypothetical protein